MPVPLIPAIVGSIIESAVDQAATPQPVQPPGPVVGVVRTLPADSLRGNMSAAAIGAVEIDGKMLPLSPAAQIRNEANMIVVPTTIQQTVAVRYIKDEMGNVLRIWILTPAELAASR